jgi:type III secretion protein J
MRYNFMPRFRKNWFLLLLTFVLTGCGRLELYSNLEEREANEMISILSEKGISAGKKAGEDNRYSVDVAPNKFAEAVALLKTGGLPRDTFSKMGEVFKKSGLVSSPTEERIRFMNALADSISETITHINGVVTARVHIVLPNNDPFADNTKPSSASVFIKAQADSNVEASIPQIKNLVVNSVEGLTYERVSVGLFTSTEWPTILAEEKGDSSGEEALIGWLASHMRLVGAGVIILLTLALGLLLWTVSRRRRTVSDTSAEA